MAMPIKFGSPHIIALVLIFLEIVSDRLVESLTYVISYPIYYHIPSTYPVQPLPYLERYLLPPRRFYRFFILYVPVLILWKTTRKILKSRHYSSIKFKRNSLIVEVENGEKQELLEVRYSLNDQVKELEAYVDDEDDVDYSIQAEDEIEREDIDLKEEESCLEYEIDWIDQRECSKFRGQQNVSDVLTKLHCATFNDTQPHGALIENIYREFACCLSSGFSDIQNHYLIPILNFVKDTGNYFYVWIKSHFSSSKNHCLETLSVWITGLLKCHISIRDIRDNFRKGHFTGHILNYQRFIPLRKNGFREEVKYYSSETEPEFSCPGCARSYKRARQILPEWTKDYKYGTTFRQYNKRFTLYQKLPLKAISREWGRICGLELPMWIRKPGFNFYIWFYNCQFHEAAIQDLESYNTISEFFRRELKPGVREICHASPLVSPADGRILTCGLVTSGCLEQIKGVAYSLKGFLGPLDILKQRKNSNDQEAINNRHKSSSMPTTINLGRVTRKELNFTRGSHSLYNYYVPNFNKASLENNLETGGIRPSVLGKKLLEEPVLNLNDGNASNRMLLIKPAPSNVDPFMNPNEVMNYSKYQRSDMMYEQEILQNSTENRLYHCVVYLAPGDYHRFHSPVNWTVTARRHFSGELFSVNPGIARWLQGLFNFNERVLYVGEWEHGFFSMTAVGATTVGAINVIFDKDLKTNTQDEWINETYEDLFFQESAQDGQPMKHGVKMRKGDLFGDFNFGSTIVLLFEAPKNFKFNLEPGTKVKYGESLGILDNLS